MGSTSVTGYILYTSPFLACSRLMNLTSLRRGWGKGGVRLQAPPAGVPHPRTFSNLTELTQAEREAGEAAGGRRGRRFKPANRRLSGRKPGKGRDAAPPPPEFPLVDARPPVTPLLSGTEGLKKPEERTRGGISEKGERKGSTRSGGSWK